MTIEQTVMRRVYMVYTLRRIFSPRAFKYYALITAGTFFVSVVSFQAIIENMPKTSNMSDYANFYESAFIHTEVGTKIALVAIALAFLLIVRDALKSFLPHSFLGLGRQTSYVQR